MLVRLLGGEAEAEVNVYQTPFTDVPDWAQPYVGWLYENKMCIRDRVWNAAKIEQLGR